MSWSDTINKLSLTTKNMLVVLVIVMPFWLVAIYMLNKPLYNSGDYIIITAFCFCFSVTWCSLSLLFAVLADQLNKKKHDLKAATIVGGVLSVLYLSLSIIVSYYFKWRFSTFLIVAYAYMFFVLFKTLVRIEMQKDALKKEAEEKKKSD